MKTNGMTAIILAAGLSHRMGKFKALLPWRGMPLIQYQLEQMKRAGMEKIIVVLGHQANQLKQVIAKYDVETVINEQYPQGKSTSIRKGIAHIPNYPKGILISAVDQPVPYPTLGKIIGHLSITKAPAIIPVYQGQSGHPILFHSNLKADLLAVNEETKGLRKVIQKHYSQIEYLDVSDPSVLLNFNKPSDYSKNCLQGGSVIERFRD